VGRADLERFAVRRARTAVDDLPSILDDVAEADGVGAAEPLYDRIAREVASLETMPFRCRVVPELEAEGLDGYREVLVGPFRLMFAVRGREIVLLTALDGRRDLGELLIARALRGGPASE
jgi:toxin ParE1/3/4